MSGAIHVKGRLDEFLAVDLPSIAGASQAAKETSGEAVFLVLYRLATDPVLGEFARPIIIGKVSKIFGAEFLRLLRYGPAAGAKDNNIMDTHDYDFDHAQSGNSVEFFFDGSSHTYLDFIEEVRGLAYKYAPVFGYAGIRFMPAATALIAMQRFPLTVAVEIATVRARHDDIYKGFWDALHSAANSVGGIPHWGQEFRQSAAEIATHYGERIVTWRQMLAELSIDSPNTFSTPFSRDAGLEPTEATGIFDSDAIEQFLVALDGAAD